MSMTPHPADDRTFFARLSWLAALIIVVGFGHTYPGHAVGAPALPVSVHVHAAVFGCWLALFLTQTTLVRRRRIALHRTIGRAGAVLAALMLVVGTWTAIDAARGGHRGIPGVEFPTPAGFLLLNLASLAIFVGLTAAGLAYRRQAAAHKRLMWMAMAGGLVPPGASRLPFVSGDPAAIAAVVMVIILVGPAYDLWRHRWLHPAYRWSLPACALILPPIVLGLSGLAPWQRFTEWVIR